MKDVARTDVERFLRRQGYEAGRTSGKHTMWVKPGWRSIPIPRHRHISPGVVRQIERVVGFVPREWK